MKNNNPYFKQINKDTIIRCEAISNVYWNKEEKKYHIGMNGTTYYFNKKEGDKILESISIKP